MNIWLDDDIPVKAFAEAIAAAGFSLRHVPGQVYTLRVMRRVEPTVVTDFFQAQRRRDAATDIAMRDGMRGLHGLPPGPPKESA